MFHFRLAMVICPVACGLMVAFSVRTSAQDTADKSQPTSFWMQRKLEFSKQILAGIATADFEKMVENGEAMRKLSTIEGFIRGRTPGYRTQLQVFEDSADEIVRQAKKDNVDGAALAFTQLTISCVNCHKQLRATE
jgi:hypothetical protein